MSAGAREPAAPRPAAFLVGATGTGKSDLALRLAEALDLEIVCMDSMQVYRGVPIVTAQPDPGALARVPHHLYGIRDLAEHFDTARYLEEARALSGGRRYLFVGGTGLYYNALLDGLAPLPGRDDAVRAGIAEDLEARGVEALRRELEEADPASARRIEPTDLRRLERALEVLRITGRPMSELLAEEVAPDWTSRVTLGLRPDRDWLRARLARRLDAMVEAGLLDELRGIHERFADDPTPRTALQAIGIRLYAEHVAEGGEPAALLETLLHRHRQYARRQETWFRKRAEVRWLDPADPAAFEAARELLAG